jgi:hypothetical protein
MFMRVALVVVIGVTGVIGVAGCIPGAGTKPKKSSEERYEDDWFERNYKYDSHFQPFTSVPHPSATGTLPENSVNASTRPGDRGGTDIWLSITELTDKRVCLDFGAFVTSRNPKNFDLHDMVKDVERGRVFLRSHTGRKIPLAITETLPTEVLATWVADLPYMVDQDTGRTATQCVEQLTNQYGTVVGCARYEEVAITTKVETTFKATLIRHYGGIRMCAANDGLVPSDAPWVGIVYGNVPYRRRFDLTGGIAKTGSWGATGGRSALLRYEIKDKKVVPASGGKSVAVMSPKTARPATHDKAQSPPRSNDEPVSARPGEAELLLHAGGRLKLEAFSLVAPNGATIIEVTTTGQVRARGNVIGAIQANGIVRDAVGHATHALDSSGWLWRIHDGKVTKAAKLSSNVAQVGTMSIAYKKDGSFVLNGTSRKEFPNRVKPVGISDMLALVFALSIDDDYFGTPK